MKLVNQFRDQDPFAVISKEGLMRDTEMAFAIEAEQQNLPDVAQVKNAYILFVQHLLEDWDGPVDLFSLSSTAQHSVLKAVYTLIEMGNEQIGSYDPTKRVTDDMIAAAIIRPVLERHPERKDMLKYAVSQNAITLLDEINYLSFQKSKGFDLVSPEAKTLHLACGIAEINQMVDILNSNELHLTSEDDVLPLKILIMYKQGLILNLAGQTTMEATFLENQRDMILNAKSHLSPPPKAQILQFPNFSKV
jgi:hypothetical protein